MYIVSVQVHVKPEYVEQFIEATRLNQHGSRTTEPGNVRWDFSQSEEDPTRFLLYEVYRTKEDFPKHRQTQHFLTWQAAVTDMMAEPRVATRYFNLYPDDASWNK